MIDGIKLWIVSTVADATLFTIEAISFYSLRDINSVIIYGPARFAFLFIALVLMGAT